MEFKLIQITPSNIDDVLSCVNFKFFSLNF